MILPLELFQGLGVILARHTSQKREVDRVLLILELSKANPSEAARRMNCGREKAYRWYHRTGDLLAELPKHSPMTVLQLERHLRCFLKDNMRPGAPPTYSPEQQCAIVAIALEKPEKYSVESEKWTHRELAMVARQQGIADSVSRSTVGRILAEANIKPHRSKYWEFPNIEDPEVFDTQITEINRLYRSSRENLQNNIHTVCVDEKTGMQALERINPDKNAIPGKVAKLEFEYKRHGTQALIPSFEVGTGRIIAYHIGATRTGKDFASLIRNTVQLDPEAGWVFVADQLNIHKSEELVRFVAKTLNIRRNLGKKGKNGILRNLESRQAFLADQSHRIRFVYTPKHCSWMNQIEIWFGILTRKILRHGNFRSITELRNRIDRFIDYYNQTMAKVFKWTYKGKALQA